jgi:hypothetical protein
VFTLFVVPVFYLLIAAEHHRTAEVEEPADEELVGNMSPALAGS